MWSNSSARPLVIHPEPSRCLAAWLVLVHGLAGAGLIAAAMPLVAAVGVGVLLFSLNIHLMRLGFLAGRPVIQGLRLEVDGRCRVQTADGHWRPAVILPGSFCAPWLCVLQLRVEGRWQSLSLAPDSLPADQLRRLRMGLLALRPNSPEHARGIRAGLVRLGILRGKHPVEILPMPTDQERLEALLSDDPDHVYSDEELDAIEAIDPEMALRIDRVQTQARRQGGNVVVEGPIDEAVVREAVEEARKILMQDGGDIEFVAIEDRTVRVRLKGACVGCPRSTLDLRNVVERLVRSRAPGVARVVNEF